MARTESSPGNLGSLAPKFSLKGVDEKIHSLDEVTRGAKAFLVAFICNHFPYVIAVQDRLIQLQAEFPKETFNLIAINSNDSSRYPDDSFDMMKSRALEKNYNFLYLHDETQEVAKNYGAACTPDLFLFNRDHRLVYRGRIDDNWKQPELVTSRDLANGIRLTLEGQSIKATQYSSMGCSIKWKSTP